MMADHDPLNLCHPEDCDCGYCQEGRAEVEVEQEMEKTEQERKQRYLDEHKHAMNPPDCDPSIPYRKPNAK
jgi:hypothetical protein